MISSLSALDCIDLSSFVALEECSPRNASPPSRGGPRAETLRVSIARAAYEGRSPCVVRNKRTSPRRPLTLGRSNSWPSPSAATPLLTFSSVTGQLAEQVEYETDGGRELAPAIIFVVGRFLSSLSEGELRDFMKSCDEGKALQLSSAILPRVGWRSAASGPKNKAAYYDSLCRNALTFELTSLVHKRAQTRRLLALDDADSAAAQAAGPLSPPDDMPSSATRVRDHKQPASSQPTLMRTLLGYYMLLLLSWVVAD